MYSHLTNDKGGSGDRMGFFFFLFFFYIKVLSRLHICLGKKVCLYLDLTHTQESRSVVDLKQEGLGKNTENTLTAQE